MNIWQILEIEKSPDLTLKDLKRAYAKKLKVTRPDRDPEGFQKLRAAYEDAQFLVENQALNDGPESEQNTHSFSFPIAEQIDELEQSATNGLAFGSESIDTYSSSTFSETIEEPVKPALNENEERFISIFEAIHFQLKSEFNQDLTLKLVELEEFVLAHPLLIQRWSEEVADLYYENPDLFNIPLNGFDYVPSFEVLIAELQSECSAVTLSFVDRWVSLDDHEKLREFSEIIIENKAILYSDNMVYLSIRLCIALSIVDVKLAKSIGEIAYEVAGSNSADQIPVDNAIDFSIKTNALNPGARRFWSDIINRRATKADLNDPEKNYYFEEFLQSIINQEDTTCFLMRCTDDTIAQTIEEKLKQNSQYPKVLNITKKVKKRDSLWKDGKAPTPTSNNVEQEEKGGRVSVWGWGIIIVMIISGLSNLFDNSGSSSSMQSSQKLINYEKLENSYRVDPSDPEAMKQLMEKIKKDREMTLDISKSPHETSSDDIHKRNKELLEKHNVIIPSIESYQAPKNDYNYPSSKPDRYKPSLNPNLPQSPQGSGLPTHFR